MCAEFCYIKRVLLVASLLAATSTQAQESTMVLSRLFTNSAERSELNAARQKYRSGADGSTAPVVAEPEERSLRELRYDGVVKRADGSHAIWLNGQQYTKPIEGLDYRPQLLADGSVRLSLPQGERIRLRPGQAYVYADALVKEGYQFAAELRKLRAAEELETRSVEVDNVASEDKTDTAEKTAEFDEAQLAEQITRIRLLETRIEELEKQRKEPQQDNMRYIIR